MKEEDEVLQSALNGASEGPGQAGDVFRRAIDLIEASSKKMVPLADQFWRGDAVQRLVESLRKPGAEAEFSSAVGAALESDPVKVVRREIADKRDSVERLARSLFEAKQSGKEAFDTEEALREEVSHLKRQKDLAFILENVHAVGAHAVMEDDALRSKFLNASAQPMYVMSVDIRRSTDMMLKAKSAQHFADFITRLCGDLTGIVKQHYGVIDKFTGDGILCFFPEFFSGEDAGYLAVSAAQACHQKFEEHYRECRSYFVTLMRDVGLGVGIDYGLCHLVQVAGGLTVVGAPAVYACRFANAPAGCTLLNQPAFDEVHRLGFESLSFEETEVEVKREGKMIAYRATILEAARVPMAPKWAQEDASYS